MRIPRLVRGPPRRGSPLLCWEDGRGRRRPGHRPGRRRDPAGARRRRAGAELQPPAGLSAPLSTAASVSRDPTREGEGGAERRSWKAEVERRLGAAIKTAGDAADAAAEWGDAGAARRQAEWLISRGLL